MSRLDRNLREQTVDSTSSAGSSSAAKIKPGPNRATIDVFVDVTTASGDVIVEVSSDGSTWRQLSATSVSTGGVWINETSTYAYARVYAQSAFSDADINVIEISAGK